jgi:hypothetical protein
MILPSGPDTPPNYGEKISSLLSKMEGDKRAVATFPYLTSDGINFYCTDNAGEDWRDKCRSKWVVGLNQGITHPDVIRSFSSYPESEVRVYLPRENVKKESLFKPPHIHAKVIGLYTSIEPSDSHVLCTSANATSAAVGRTPKNFEMGTLISGNVDEIIPRSFWDWWGKIMSHTVAPTDNLLDRYESVRDGLSNEIQPEVDENVENKTSSSSDSKYLWTGTGSMQGQQRYILEIKEELANFFDEKTDGASNISLFFRGEMHNDLKLVKHEGHYSPQWRVFLPTDFPDHDREFYRYKCARFEKLSNPNVGHFYELKVAESENYESENWKTQAEKHGVYDQTSGGREYGYY